MTLQEFQQSIREGIPAELPAPQYDPEESRSSTCLNPFSLLSFSAARSPLILFLQWEPQKRDSASSPLYIEKRASIPSPAVPTLRRQDTSVKTKFKNRTRPRDPEWPLAGMPGSRSPRYRKPGPNPLLKTQYFILLSALGKNASEIFLTRRGPKNPLRSLTDHGFSASLHANSARCQLTLCPKDMNRTKVIHNGLQLLESN